MAASLVQNQDEIAPPAKRQKLRHVTTRRPSSTTESNGSNASEYSLIRSPVDDNAPTFNGTSSFISNNPGTSNHPEGLCKFCQQIDLYSATYRQLKTHKHTEICTLLNIESEECSLCTFFRELRSLRSSIGLDFTKEIGGPYTIRIHSAGGICGIKPLSKSSILFSIAPPGEVVKFSAHLEDCIYSFGRFFSSPTSSPIQSPSLAFFLPKALEWMSFCKKHHTKLCVATKLPHLPMFRVIDCNSRTVIPWDSDDADQHSVYVSLSYVWGQEVHDIHRQDDGTLPETLPRIIEDSIAVTIQLGYRYLWIDRYCIPEVKHAKSYQIENMNLIYKHSELTIIAASGSDPSHGLPGVRGNVRRIYPSITLVDKTFHPWLSNAAQEINRSMWNTRGWTYQEGSLSRRCLVFTDSQTYFQCRGMHCQESISIPLTFMHTRDRQRFRDTVCAIPRSFIAERTLQKSFAFHFAVARFCRRVLTVDNDVLNAFKGLLHEFRTFQTYPIDNYLGIPLYSSQQSHTDVLVFGMSWGMNHIAKDDFIDSKQIESESPLGQALRREHFPSWTWLGWTVSSTFDLRFDLASFPLCVLISPKRILSPAWKNDDETTDRKFTSCVQIHMQLPGNPLLAWEQDRGRIVELYHRGIMPSRMRIDGWTMKLDVHPNDMNEMPLSSNEQISFSLFWVNRQAMHHVYIFADEETWERSDSGMIRLKLILLSRWSVPWSQSITVMVIGKLKVSDGVVVHARIGLLHLNLKDHSHPRVWDEDQGCPGPDLEYECSKETIWLE
jgi:hypothetical protein